MAGNKVTSVNDASFDKEVLKADKPVLVDFWAPWCGPCRAIAPVVDALADQYDGKVKVVKVNTDDSQQVAAQFGIMSIPALFVFKDGKVSQQLIGANPQKLKEMVARAAGA